MDKLIKLQSRIFSLLFLVLGIAEFIGFLLEGKKHCLYAFLFMMMLALILHIDYKRN